MANELRLKLQKTLRIWISNSVEDQVWQGNGLSVDAFDFTPSMESSYRVKIEGRLIDEDSNEGEDVGSNGEASKRGIPLDSY